MRSGFLVNVFFVILINLLIKPLYIFGIDRVVQNEVGASAYGLFFALFNFAYLFQIINDFGVQNYNHSLFSRHDHLVSKYLPKTLGTKLVLMPIFVMITYLSALLLGYEWIARKLLLLILVNQILVSLVMLARTTLSAKGFYFHDSLMSVVDKLVMIIILGYLLYFSPIEVTIDQFVLAQTASLLMACALAFILLMSKAKLQAWKISWDSSFTRWQLKQSYPFALVLLLMTLYTRMDGVMIERLLPDGQSEAGIYAASYRILDAVNMLGLLVAGLLLPMFGKSLGQPNQIGRLLRMSSGLLLSASLLIALLSFTYASPIMLALYEEATSYWAQVFQILMLCYVAICMIYIFSTYLTAAQDLRDMNRVFIFGVVLNFMLNFFLILQYKAWGAALATCITQGATALLLIIIVLRKMNWPSHRVLIMRTLGYISILLLMHFLIQSTRWSFILKMSTLAILGLLAAILTKLIDLRELRAELADRTE